jgi:hypothetical protein
LSGPTSAPLYRCQAPSACTLSNKRVQTNPSDLGAMQAAFAAFETAIDGIRQDSVTPRSSGRCSPTPVRLRGRA